MTEKLNALLDKGLQDGVFPGYHAAVGEGDTLPYTSFGG